MSVLFVTGTGTDIGKTHVTAGLLRALRARGLDAGAIKPVVSGFDPVKAASSDPGVLLAAMGRAATEAEIAAISPFRFRAPLSPDMAARAEGGRLSISEIVAFCREATAATRGPLLIEGVGGVMSPVAEDATCLDLIKALKVPALLVAGTYLGAISHTLTAVASMGGIDIRAVVVNESAAASVGVDETRASLRKFLRDVDITTLRRGADQAAFAHVVDGLFARGGD